ncbi:MAG: InlB B-repeat-containing protein, partial [Rectinema subterraneum]|uniref:InlB B-repeat-containing protein n=1 Tax=Rectinema subterraneum TaxID=2653714 RepID=UPI003C79C6E8
MKQQKAYLRRGLVLLFSIFAVIVATLFSCNIFGEYNNPQDPKNDGGAGYYSVTYNANGATSGSVPTDSNHYLQGATVTVLGNTGSLAKTGYTFAGWNTKADGTGANYAEGNTFTMGSANVTLYAKWTALPTYTVTYNANGATSGSVPTDSNHYLQGAT